MNITDGMLADFFSDQGWAARSSCAAQGQSYRGVRLWYDGCCLEDGMLYIADGAAVPENIPPQSLCLLGGGPASAAWLVEAPCGLLAFYAALQRFFEGLAEWDRKLSELLLSNGAMQEILDCSGPILQNPCFLLSEQFAVLAHYGEATQEENPYFYETLKNGRSPLRLFEDLLATPARLRDGYTPSHSTQVVQGLSNYKEILGNCFIDGLPALRLCMICTVRFSGGIRDLVTHLMERIENSPSMQSWAVHHTTASDLLFSHIIENPSAPDIAETAKSLGLHLYDRFCVVEISFGSQPASAASTLSKLRMLHPGIHFFLYNDQSYALLGMARKNMSADRTLRHLRQFLYSRLDPLGASYGCSDDFSDTASLGAGCAQARYVRKLLELSGTFSSYITLREKDDLTYRDVMAAHILQTFFEHYEFERYCPEHFLRIAVDDKNTNGNNLELLYTYLCHECNATATARILHMHRNNVIYRVNKLEERYHLDLASSGQRLLLQLFCLAVGYRRH